MASLHLSLPAERTKKGVQIPLPEGMDFTKEVVTNHAVRGQPGPPRWAQGLCPVGQGLFPPSLMLILSPLQGFLTVGADLHFSKELREVIEKYRPAPTAAARPSSEPTAASMEPPQL